MKIIDLIQGSPEWHAHRAKCFNASEAAAMMGVDKNGNTRTDLIKMKSLGTEKEVHPFVQKFLFDKGHEVEALARPIVAARLGEELFPVTGMETVDGLNLSASFDGITMLGDIIWENKLLNGDLAEVVQGGELAPHYYWQLEQQLLVSGAEKAYFTTSDGTEANTHGCFYESVPQRRAKLIAGWKQFAEDLANYQHVEAAPEVVAAPIEALPALLVQVEGRVVATNMDAFKAKAGEFIASIKTELKTDQDFADADKMVKFLGDGEKQLVAVKQHAQAQAADIDAVFKAIDDVREQMRTTRIKLEKLVAAEKDNRKAEIINGARWELQSYIGKLNERIGIQMPPIQDRFAEAIKGLKSLDSMREKVGNALRDAQFEASEIADRIELNAKAAKDAMHLFPDFVGVCTKANDDFAALLALRIQQEEQRKEAEREKIRREEADRITREAAHADAQAKAQAAQDARDADQRGKADTGMGLEQSGRAQPVIASTPPITPEQAVMDAEKDLREFLEAKVPAKSRNSVRAAIVEWEKWKAERGLKVAA